MNFLFPNCRGKHHQHVHEFLGSTRFAEGSERHNHRFAGVSGPATPYLNNHVHVLETRTDNTNHFHNIRVTSGPGIEVGNGRHVHFVYGTTSCENGHDHTFILATLIEAPTE